MKWLWILTKPATQWFICMGVIIIILSCIDDIFLIRTGLHVEQIVYLWLSKVQEKLDLWFDQD